MQEAQSKKLMILLIFILLLVLASASLTGLMFLQQDEDFEWPFQSQPVEQPNLFFPMEKVMISIRGDQQKVHYLMLNMVIQTRDPQQLAALEEASPLIHNTLIRFFRSQDYHSLQAMEQLEPMQEQVKAALSQTLEQNNYPSRDIQQVLFTKLVLQ